MLVRNLLSLYAPSGLHKGLLTMTSFRAAYSDNTCFKTGGVSCGAVCGVPFLGGVWVMGLRGINTYGTTCRPPGSLICWGHHSVCLGVCLPPVRCLGMVWEYVGTVGGLEQGIFWAIEQQLVICKTWLYFFLDAVSSYLLPDLNTVCIEPNQSDISCSNCYYWKAEYFQLFLLFLLSGPKGLDRLHFYGLNT